MGITANKICGICGKKIGTLAAIYTDFELRDNCYICSECRDKCSPFLNGEILLAWTSDDVRKHMRNLSDMRRKIQTEFHETDAVYSKFENEKLLCVDAVNKWFYTPQNPELFSLSQIKSWGIQIDTDIEESGIRIAGFTPPRAEMPVPGRLETILEMDFVIELKNHPYADRIEIKICGKNNKIFKRDISYFHQAYDTAEALYELMEKFATKRNITGTITFYD